MRSPPFKITQAQPIARVHVDFPADRFLIDNPTPNLILIRLGGDATPTLDNADFVVPAASSRVWPMSGGDLVATFSGTAAPTADVSSGLASTATVQLLSRDEPDPGIAALSFLNLSLSAPQTLAAVAAGTLGPFDLSTWGGMLVAGFPQAALPDSHGYLVYETGPDLVQWHARARLPLWPGVELSGQLPRYDRYARLRLGSYAAPIGNPARTFTISARPTLTEVLKVESVLASAPFIPAGWGPLVGAGATEIHYLPGDLVSAINYGADIQSGVGTAAGLLIRGYMDVGLVAASVPQADVALLTGTVAHGTLDEPLPVIEVKFTQSAGAPAGTWYALPLTRPGQADSLGQPGDSPSRPTIPGLLAAIGANTAYIPGNTAVLGTVADAAGALTLEGQLRQVVAQTVPQVGGVPTLGFGVIPGGGGAITTGVDLPLGQRIYAVSIVASIVADAANQISAGIGTAGEFGSFMLFGAAPVTQLSMGHLFGIDYTGQRRLYVYGTAGVAGATVWATVWTA